MASKYVLAIEDITYQYQLEDFINLIKILDYNDKKVDIRFGTLTNYLYLYIYNDKVLEFNGSIKNKGKGFGSILRWVAMMVAKQFKLKVKHISSNISSFRKQGNGKAPPSWGIVASAVKPNRKVFSLSIEKINRATILNAIKRRNETPVIVSEINPNNIINSAEFGRLFRGKLLRFHKAGKHLLSKPILFNNLIINDKPGTPRD
jgi:hypothetical protein